MFDFNKVNYIYRGDIFWYTLPDGNAEKGIAHPVIIVQDTDINNSVIETVVVVGITTNRKKLSWPGNFLLSIGEANLTKPSIVDVSNIFLAKKSDLGDYIGKINANRIEQVFSGLRFIQNILNSR